MRILVPTDFSSCARAAVLHAIHLARQTSGEVFLLHVIEERDEDPNAIAEGRSAAERSRYGKYTDRLHGITFDGVQTRHAVRFGVDIVSEITGYAKEKQIDMIVMGAHGDDAADRFLMSGMEHLLVGSTTEGVVRMAECPMLTVGLRCGRRPELVRRVLLPFDVLHPDRDALQAARIIAHRYGAALDVLYVDESVSDEGTCPPVAADGPCRAMQEAFELSDGPDVPVHYHTLFGNPIERVTSFATAKDVQLIVISNPPGAGVSHRYTDGAESLVPLASFSVLAIRQSVNAAHDTPAYSFA